MRNLLLSACLSCFSSMLFAQVPQAIKYQAVARDSMGSIMENANITVRVSILDPEYSGLRVAGWFIWNTREGS